MGKYSLDAFEQYPLVKLRPAVAGLNSSCYHLLELFWSELETEAGILLPPPEIGDGKVLLRLSLDLTSDVSDACGFIRRIGSAYSGGKALAGVVITSGSFTGSALGQLIRAYRQGFAATFLLAEPGTELMDACCKAGINAGLWLPLDKGILPLRRAIAQNNLARVWRKAPVYLYSGRQLAPEELDAARRWHSSGTDSMEPLGAQMVLRRMMFPKDLTSGGILPLRMWWQNIGTAPLYHKARVVLELRNETDRFEIFVPGYMEQAGLGDSVLNANVQLPQISPGTYSVWCGLESNGTLLPLAIKVPAESGMYGIGEITLDDTPRPYLNTMWEMQYADGYYPLEDPSEPE